MAVEWADVLADDGSFTVDVAPQAEIREALTQERLGKVHLLLHEGGQVVARQVVETANPSSKGIKIVGRDLGILLGKGADGPTIVDREFVAGTNCLSDPSFELFGADALDPLYWQRVAVAPSAEAPDDDVHESRWNFIGSPRTGNYAAVMLYLPTDDDSLISTDTCEAPPGSTWEPSAWIARGAVAIPGRIRQRLVFEGRFTHPNLGSDYSTWVSSELGDIEISYLDPDHTELHIYTNDREIILNPSFDDGLDHWHQGTATWGTASAPDGTCLRTAAVPGDPAVKEIHAEAAGGGPSYFFEGQDGEEYRWGAWAAEEAGTDGEAVITMYRGSGEAVLPNTWEWADMEKLRGSGDLRWRSYSDSVFPSSPNLKMRPTIQVWNHTAGAWLFDNIRMWRVSGNTDKIYDPTGFAAIPGRTYRAKMSFRSDIGVTGIVQMRATCIADGRPEVDLQGTTLQATEGVQTDAYWDIKVPSGYDLVVPYIYSEDVKGPGAYWLRSWEIRDDDPTTTAIDVVGPGGPYDGAIRPYARTAGTIATPPGADKVHYELVGEAGCFGYTVDDVGMRRTDAGPIAASAVFAELLKDPVTGLPILNPGTLHDAGNLAWDWHLRNTVNGDAIKTLLTTGQVSPVREMRVNGPERTADMGTAEELYADRTDVILRAHQFRVLGDLEGSATIDAIADYLRVIGAERTAADGSRVTIAAEGGLPTASRYDAFGRPLRWTRTVTDSGVDNYDYAALRAVFELALAQPGPPSVTIEISDDKAWGRFSKGDWIYVYDPKAGLVDPANEMYDDELGATVWPIKLRVLDRSTSHTRSNRRLELVDPATEEAGEGLDITDAVTWSDKTTHRCTLGIRKPELLTNPAGGNAGTQLHRQLAQLSRV